MLEVFAKSSNSILLALFFDLTLRSNLSDGGDSPTPPFGGTPPAAKTVRLPPIFYFFNLSQNAGVTTEDWSAKICSRKAKIFATRAGSGGSPPPARLNRLAPLHGRRGA